MKQYFIYSVGIFLLFFSTDLSAGGDPRANTAPAAFLGSEEITIYLRVVATDLEDAEGPLYMISGANGGEMNMNLEAIKENDNVWSVTITPDTYYGVTVQTIEGKISDNNGTETNAFALIVFDPAQMDGVMVKWYPSTAIYSENMSIIFNSTMSDRDDLTGVDPIYMWAWNNPEELGDAANQGEWGSIDPSAVCVKIGEDLWRKDIVPQEYWDTEKPMSEIGCLFRNMAGDSQTEDFAIPMVAPPVTEIPKVIRPFPVKFTKKDILTIYYDLKLETNQEMKKQKEIYIETSTNVEEENNPFPGNWIIYRPAELERALLTPMDDSIYMIRFIPDIYYSLDPEYDLKQLNYIFRNKGGLAKSEQYSIKVLKED